MLRLQQTLAAREAQLEAKAGEQARLQDVVTQLMVSASCVPIAGSLAGLLHEAIYTGMASSAPVRLGTTSV